jgi:hypothetical protein
MGDNVALGSLFGSEALRYGLSNGCQLTQVGFVLHNSAGSGASYTTGGAALQATAQKVYEIAGVSEDAAVGMDPVHVQSLEQRPRLLAVRLKHASATSRLEVLFMHLPLGPSRCDRGTKLVLQYSSAAGMSCVSLCTYACCAIGYAYD